MLHNIHTISHKSQHAGQKPLSSPDAITVSSKQQTYNTQHRGTRAAQEQDEGAREGGDLCIASVSQSMIVSRSMPESAAIVFSIANEMSRPRDPLMPFSKHTWNSILQHKIGVSSIIKQAKRKSALTGACLQERHCRRLQ